MSKPLSTAGQLWQEFQRDCIPKSAPPVQHLKMQKAFYAGMFSLLSEMQKIDDSLSDEAGAEILEGYQAEIIGFLSSLQAIRGKCP